MNRKRNVLVSSTPHPERTRQIASLFEDVDFSPIIETSSSNSKVPNGLLLKTVSSKPSTSSVKTGAIRKRRVVSKKETKPESATAGVFKELGVDRKEVGNNALSLSRNLYNMFPEPIILDSDSEENTTLVLKPPKKLKQDSKVTKSSPKKNEEKKTKERAPGGSMITNTRLTRLAVGSKEKKNTKSNSSESVSSVVKELKTSSTKPQTVTRLPGSPSNNRSLIEIDDDDEIFPIYEPGASIHQSSKTNKRSENVRLSLELADNFPIQWRGRCKKTTDIDESVLEFVNSDINKNKIEQTNKKYNKPSTKPKFGEVNEENHLNDLKPSNSEDDKDGCVFKENENIGAKIDNDVQKSCDKIKDRKTSKTDVLQEIEPKGSASIDVKPQSRLRKVSSKEKENSVQISRFEDVVFKVNHANGGIIAKSLKTDKNDIGYLEVVPGKIFQGQNANITFVVIEGKAKVVHLGSHQILSPGDMIHISSDSGYNFEAAGKRHVRLLYIKAH